MALPIFGQAIDSQATYDASSSGPRGFMPRTRGRRHMRQATCRDHAHTLSAFLIPSYLLSKAQTVTCRPVTQLLTVDVAFFLARLARATGAGWCACM